LISIPIAYKCYVDVFFIYKRTIYGPNKISCMRILIDILHPAHVHFFKNYIKQMEKKGHEILVVSREKEMTNYLLSCYKVNYISISKIKKGLLNLAKELLFRTRKLYKIVDDFKPHLLLGIMGPSIAPIGWVKKIPTLVFYDTESAKPTNYYVYPLASKVITPSCYQNDLGKKHIKYKGLQELAYLHPNYFQPNPKILDKLDLKNNEPYFVIRTVSWGASHDIGHKGIDKSSLENLISILENYGKVVFTTEIKSNTKEPDQLFKPEEIHDLLYYSTLYIGEGATMASEAAILGVPSFFISSFAHKLGYLKELREKHKLLFEANTLSEDIIGKITDLLENISDSKSIWSERQKAMLAEMVDVTDFMINFSEEYFRK